MFLLFGGCVQMWNSLHTDNSTLYFVLLRYSGGCGIQSSVSSGRNRRNCSRADQHACELRLLSTHWWTRSVTLDCFINLTLQLCHNNVYSMSLCLHFWWLSGASLTYKQSNKTAPHYKRCSYNIMTDFSYFRHHAWGACWPHESCGRCRAGVHRQKRFVGGLHVEHDWWWSGYAGLFTQMLQRICVPGWIFSTFSITCCRWTCCWTSYTCSDWKRCDFLPALIHLKAPWQYILYTLQHVFCFSLRWSCILYVWY